MKERKKKVIFYRKVELSKFLKKCVFNGWLNCNESRLVLANFLLNVKALQWSFDELHFQSKYLSGKKEEKICWIIN